MVPLKISCIQYTPYHINEYIVNRFFIFKSKTINSMSNDTYVSFRQDLNLDLPSIHQLKKLKKSISPLFPLQKTQLGVQNNIRQKLRSVLIPLLKNENESFLMDENIIKIKICGDGTKIGKFNF